MKLRIVAGGSQDEGGDCPDGDCPTVRKTDRDSYLVQGYRVADHGLTLPPGEDIVELPGTVVRELVKHLSE